MQIHHMSGAGNDFMVLDARGKNRNLQKLTRALCPITHADGLLALDNSQVADFRLHFYNSDGSRGEMCGNGARCICKFARELGIVKDSMVLETDAGLIYGYHLGDNQYRLQMNLPGILDFQCKPPIAYVELGNPGIPHGILEVPKLSWEQAEALRDTAKTLCHDPAFPKGANITFYSHLEDGKVRVLTYERFVEDYTLACGTGCTAVAAVLYLQGKLPNKVLTAENKGGILRVTVVAEADTITALFLEGPAETVKVYEMPDSLFTDGMD